MKAISIFFTLFLMANCAYAQYWIVGDTVGRQQVTMEHNFEPNAEVIFDIDCDGIGDLNIFSLGGYKWPILHFGMQDDVEGLHDFGNMRTYEVGDTLPYVDSLWTTLLDYIFGVGGGGAYGQLIDNKFIAYRKNAIDTAYCFIRISNQGINYTIHEIISSCATNPLDIIITTPDKIEEIEEPEEEIITDSLTIIYPNPATFLFNQITIDGIDIKEVVFYNNFGRKIFKVPYTRQMYLPYLPKGLNFVKIVHENGDNEILKLIIQ